MRYEQTRLERLADEMEVPADELRWWLRMLVDEESRRRGEEACESALVFFRAAARGTC